MPRRTSSKVKPIRVGGKDAISLELVSKNRLKPVTAETSMEFDWRAFFNAIGFRPDERAFLERKQLGQQQAPQTGAVRARVARRLKKAKAAGIKRSDFGIPVRGGDSRHLVYAETLPGGRKVLTLSRLDSTFAQIMGAELQNIFVDSRTKRASLGGSSRSSEIMEHSDIKLEVKNLTDQGTFEGDLAVYSNTDYGGDQIVPGSFRKTLAENQGKIALFMNHDTGDLRQKIGVLYLTDSQKALKARGVLNLELASAKEARSIIAFDLQHGLKTSMSIGYKTIVEKVQDGVRFLKEIQLFEGSLVGMGMNNMANVTAAKAHSDAQLSSLLHELKRTLHHDWSSGRNPR
jgi:HK97 family phage prohead protease